MSKIKVPHGWYALPPSATVKHGDKFLTTEGWRFTENYLRPFKVGESVTRATYIRRIKRKK